jgi:hypothetical protein
VSAGLKRLRTNEARIIQGCTRDLFARRANPTTVCATTIGDNLRPAVILMFSRPAKRRFFLVAPLRFDDERTSAGRTRGGFLRGLVLVGHRLAGAGGAWCGLRFQVPGLGCGRADAQPGRYGAVAPQGKTLPKSLMDACWASFEVCSPRCVILTDCSAPPRSCVSFPRERRVS